MHNIDRVRLEVPFQGESFEAEALEAEQFEFEEEGPYEHGQLWGETENMELASGLLEVSNEAEFEQFLGDLVARAGGVLGGFVPPQQRQVLTGILKGAAQKILPAIGGYLGGSAGAALASDAGRAFGLELEGLSGEDREFEVARRYVDVAGEAVRQLVKSAHVAAPTAAAALAAVRAAAATHAPGLPAVLSKGDRPGQSGRWECRGNTIILYGV
jgi:hypothetical protein